MSDLEKDRQLYQEGVRDGRMEKGYMAPENMNMSEYFSKFPSVRRQYDLLREEVKDMRDQWFEGTMQEHTFEIYKAKLCMLMIMKMWSWNYYKEEDYIHDDEIGGWFTEVANAG
jgi:hypothetical protein